MLFIGLVSNFFDGVVSAIGGTVFDAIRGLFYSLDTIIYKFIIFLYNWFLMLCNGRLLDSEEITVFTDRIGLILGVLMFFNVAVAFIQMLLDPDKLQDKEMGAGALVKKTILVVVMLGVSSFVFELAYDTQKILLGNNSTGTNVVQNVFLPYKVDTDNFGGVLSAYLFTSLYRVDDAYYDEGGNLSEDFADNSDVIDCENYVVALRNQIRNANRFSLGYTCLNARTAVSETYYSGGSTEDYIIDFNWLLSPIVGVFVCYMLFVYCINVAVRMIQLAFLEIISPAAIVSYLSPKKETMFDKWKNVYISTYIDVFVRVGIINLVVYLIALVLNNANDFTSGFWSSFNSDITNPYTKVFITIILILALLTFAKRAPELLKAILPQGGAGSIGYGIGAKDNEFGMGLLSKGAGVLGGAVGGLVGGAVGGGLSGAALGLIRGGAGGLKNKKLGDTLKSVTGGYGSQKGAALRTRQRIAEGGSMFVSPGAQRLAAVYDEEKAMLEAENAAYNQYAGYFKTMDDEANKDIMDGKYASNSHAVNAVDADRRMKMYQAQMDALDRNDGDFESKYAAINADFTKYQEIFNEELKAARADYVDDAINGRNNVDNARIVQARDMADALIKSNSEYEGFKGQSTSSYSSMKNARNAANAQSSKNTVALSRNASEGKRARADAKYSGGGKH